jgi:3-deoxy-D-manno-octulosonic acid kinase
MMPALSESARYDSGAQIQRTHRGLILYDPELVDQPQSHLFDPEWIQVRGRVESVAASGRGEAWFVDLGEQHWVLRHYLRGGQVAKFNKQYYVGCHAGRSRAWREWRLLSRLHDEFQLPVPRPVAARIDWPYSYAPFLYQASIMIQRIPGARTLARMISDHALDDSLWQAVGACIRRFHDRGVFHADLNANNILFDIDNRVYLIDFDKGDIRGDGPWKQSNLDRLHRSLEKIGMQNPGFPFNAEHWQQLLAGYRSLED